VLTGSPTTTDPFGIDHPAPLGRRISRTRPVRGRQRWGPRAMAADCSAAAACCSVASFQRSGGSATLRAARDSPSRARRRGIIFRRGLTGARLRPEPEAAHGQPPGHFRSADAPVAKPHAAPSVARPWTRLSSVAVRGNRRLHRPSWRPHAVRYTSVDSATQRSTALRDDTRRDKANGPHSHVSAANGPFSQVVAGDGFEPSKA
jgi:hypothetical protein